MFSGFDTTKRLLTSGMLLAVASCSPRMAGEGPAPAGLPSDNTRYATEITAGTCVTDPKGEAAFLLPGIAAALLSSAISTGVNRVGAVLKASAEPGPQTVVARRNLEVSRNGFGPCVQLVRGWFYESPPALAADGAPEWGTESFLTPGERRTLWRNGMWLAAAPDFYFEGRFRPSKDGSHLTIEPNLVRLDKPIARPLLRPDGQREVLVSFSIVGAGDSIDLQGQPGATLTIGTLQPGAARAYPAGTSLLTELPVVPPAPPVAPAGGSPPAPPPVTPTPTTSPPPAAPGAPGFGAAPGGFVGGGGPPPPPVAGAAGVEPPTLIRSPLESEWFTIALGEERKPITVAGLVSEVQGKSEFLSFVADVFEGASGSITEQLQTALVPAKREAAREQVRDQEQAATIAYNSALGDAFAALDACAKGGSNPVQLAVTAANAMLALNGASRDAGKGDGPFSRSDIAAVDPRRTPAQIVAACQVALQRL